MFIDIRTCQYLVMSTQFENTLKLKITSYYIFSGQSCEEFEVIGFEGKYDLFFNKSNLPIGGFKYSHHLEISYYVNFLGCLDNNGFQLLKMKAWPLGAVLELPAKQH